MRSGAGSDQVKLCQTVRGLGSRLTRSSSWRFLDVRRWSIRPKLIAVVLIPTVAALVLGALEMESALSAGATYARVDTLAKIQPQLNSLVAAVQAERTGAAGVVATPTSPDPAGIASERSATDAAVTAFRATLSSVDSSQDPALRAKLLAADSNLDRLGTLRASADAHSEGPTTAMADYTQIVQSVTTITDELATQRSNSAVTRGVSGLQSLAAAKEAASQQQGFIYAAALNGGTLNDATYQQLITANAAQYIGVVGLLDSASPALQTKYQSLLGEGAVQPANAVISRVLSTRSAVGIGMTPAQWLTASTQQLARMEQIQSEQVNEVDKLVNQLTHGARTSALISAAFIFLILGFALLATFLVARSILRPLRLLRSAALGVAYEGLPATVRRLQDDPSAEGALEVAPIGVDSSDEIGQVARAFDAVHTEAVYLAGQQALMRGNVSKMFINLSRRSQSLVERQLRLIDELEASERDADQLSNLFKLDHLATRMRRNDESLLVLAGEEGARRRSDPVAMLDVLRAASGEVEHYSRVQLDAQPGYELAGGAVSDVVHLIAELVENATTFSPPSTLVWVRSHSLGAGGEMMIEIEDHGIGMGPAELAAANDKLATPGGMDVSMSRLMGLFVVGRLAQRHGILVQLRPSAYGGVTAFVRLPAALITNPVGELEAAPQPVVDQHHLDPENSPIFEAMQSEWFARRPIDAPIANGTSHPASAGVSWDGPWSAPTRSISGSPPVPTSAPSFAPSSAPSSVPAAPAAQPVTAAAAVPAAPVPNWISPGDAGWRAVAEVSAQANTPDELTVAGLPVRVPGRNLLPGSANGSTAPTAPTARPADRTVRTVRPMVRRRHRPPPHRPAGSRRDCRVISAESVAAGHR